jgi:hypothetical protein
LKRTQNQIFLEFQEPSYGLFPLFCYDSQFDSSAQRALHLINA